MASKFTELAIDCADPRRLARFWCAVLGYEVREEDDGLVTIGVPLTSVGVPLTSESSVRAGSTSGGGEGRGPVPPVLTFARVPEGKTVKNRLHIDVSPTDRDQDEEVRRLLELGARPTDVGQGEESWVVLLDLEENEFCVLARRRP